MSVVNLDTLNKLFIASNVCRFTTPTASAFGDWVNLTPLLNLNTALLEGEPNKVLFVNSAGDADTNNLFSFTEDTSGGGASGTLELNNTGSSSYGSYMYIGAGVNIWQNDSGGGSATISLDRTRAHVSISSVSSGIQSLPASPSDAEAVRIYAARSTGSYSSELRILPTHSFLAGNNFGGINIGATDAPLTMLEVQEDFLVTSATSNHKMQYDGTTLDIQITGSGAIPILELFNSATPSNARLSFIQDELDNGGLAIRNSGGLEVIKLPGNINDGHSFFNLRRFSVGRNGVTSAYGGTIDGALVTLEGQRWDLNAADDYGDPNNYYLHLKSDDGANHVPAIGFTSGNGASEDSTNNIGAAIAFQHTGNYSQGALKFYTKQATTDGTAPVLALTLDENGDTNVAGNLLVATQTPASASDTGTAGTITWDSSYIYVCTATNTWKRVAIATW